MHVGCGVVTVRTGEIVIIELQKFSATRAAEAVGRTYRFASFQSPQHNPRIASQHDLP